MYGYTGVSCDDTMSFTPFTDKDLEEFQTTINTTVGKEPGSFGLMEVVNTLSDSIGGILNGLGNLLNLSTRLGAGLLALAIVAGVIVGIVIITKVIQSKKQSPGNINNYGDNATFEKDGQLNSIELKDL